MLLFTHYLININAVRSRNSRDVVVLVLTTILEGSTDQVDNLIMPFYAILLMNVGSAY